MGALFKNMMIKVLLRKPGHDTGMIIHYYVLVYRSLALGDQWACGPIQSLLQNPALGTPALGDILRHGIVWIPPWNLSWTLASSQVHQSMPHLQMRIEVRTAPIRRLLLLWSIISGQCDSITHWPPIPSHPIPVHSNRPLDSLTVWRSDSPFSLTPGGVTSKHCQDTSQGSSFSLGGTAESVSAVCCDLAEWVAMGHSSPVQLQTKAQYGVQVVLNPIWYTPYGSVPHTQRPGIPRLSLLFSQFNIYLLSLLFITARNLLAWNNTAVSSHLSTSTR